MKSSEIFGVYQDRNKLYTENPGSCRGIRVYNEKILRQKGKEYRNWNPYRSKLAAAIINGLHVDIQPKCNVLYLGAATGTTVSHVSDIVKDGIVFAVENSPISAKKLLGVCEKRSNIIPVLEDAFHPERYSSIVGRVDLVYQDISQRNQTDIFMCNIERFLKKNGLGIFMVKARSIDVSLKPQRVYDGVCKQLEECGLRIVNCFDLKPFEKDHNAIVVSY